MQVSPCASPLRSTDANLAITPDSHREGVAEIATVIDVSFRAIARGEESAQAYMLDVLPTLPRVEDAVINAKCFG